jgi:uncharacterized iron-regulated membrane protein
MPFTFALTRVDNLIPWYKCKCWFTQGQVSWLVFEILYLWIFTPNIQWPLVSHHGPQFGLLLLLLLLLACNISYFVIFGFMLC